MEHALPTVTAAVPAGPLYLKVSGRRWRVASIEDASAKFCAVRDAMGVGARDMPDARIVDAKGADLYRISYNGKVWPHLGREWMPGDEPAFNPYAA